MKKFIFSAAVVAAMAIGYTFSYSDSEQTLSDIELANVEALADIELTPGKWKVTFISEDQWECNPNGKFACPGTIW